MDSTYMKLVPAQSDTSSSGNDHVECKISRVPLITGTNSSSKTQSNSEKTAKEGGSIDQAGSCFTNRTMLSTKLISPPSGQSLLIRELEQPTQEKSGENILTLSSETLSEPSTPTPSAPTSIYGRWTNRHERILSMVALVVGFGNVWGFPYNCLQWGGAFFIPYVIVHFVVGIPIFYLELIIGQYSNKSPPGLFASLTPIMSGLGWALTLLNFIKTPTYDVIMAWCAFFFASSFQNPLPWTTCNNSWNRANCFSRPEDLANNTNLTQEQRDSEFVAKRNDFAPFEFFRYHMYNLSVPSLAHGPGQLQGHLVVCLVVTWTLSFLSVIGSMRSIGIIVYFTTPVPLLVFFVLTMVGFTLEGAGRGISFYLTPNLTLLSNIRIWFAAGIQVLFSTSTAIGCVITLGSFSSFRNNCFVDTLVTLGVNALTSVLSGFLVFSALGSMSARYNITLEHVIAGAGPETAFVAYAQALGQIGEFGVVISAVFFLACFLLGLDTLFIDVECIIVALCDRWPWLQRKRWLVALSICVTSFAIGLPMCTERGLYIFDLLQAFVSPYSSIYLAMFEVTCIVHIYGLRRLMRDIRRMMGRPKSVVCKWIGPSGLLWQWVWFAVTSPLLFLSLAAVVVHGFDAKSITGVPRWTNIFGYGIAVTPFWIVFLYGVVLWVHQIYIKGSFNTLLKPTPYWCPAHKQRPKTKIPADENVDKSAITDLAGVPPVEIVIPPFESSNDELLSFLNV